MARRIAERARESGRSLVGASGDSADHVEWFDESPSRGDRWALAGTNPVTCASWSWREGSHRATAEVAPPWAAMDDVGQQCVMRLRRDRIIAPTIPERRLLARTVLTVGRDFPIVAFQWSDTHGHMAVAADPVVSAEAARRIEGALKQVLRLPVPFAPVDLTPIRDVWHMKSVVRYIYTQGDHHGYRDDPLREGSSLPDALGWRTLGARTARTLHAQQPRLTRAGLLEMVDLVDTDVPVRWDADWCDAVAAASCRADGRGKHRDTLAARAAIVRLASETFTPADIRDRLRVSARSYGRLLEVTPAAGVIRAVRQQLVVRSPTFVRSAKEAAKLAAAAEASRNERSLPEPAREWRIIEPQK